MLSGLEKAKALKEFKQLRQNKAHLKGLALAKSLKRMRELRVDLGMTIAHRSQQESTSVPRQAYQLAEKPTITRRQKDNAQAVALMRELQQQNRQATDLAKIPANTTVWELNANQGLFIDLAMFDNRLRGIQ